MVCLFFQISFKAKGNLSECFIAGGLCMSTYQLRISSGLCLLVSILSTGSQLCWFPMLQLNPKRNIVRKVHGSVQSDKCRPLEEPQRYGKADNNSSNLVEKQHADFSGSSMEMIYYSVS